MLLERLVRRSQCGVRIGLQHIFGARSGIGEDGARVGFIIRGNLKLQRAESRLHDAGIFAGEESLDSCGLQAQARHFRLQRLIESGYGHDVCHSGSPSSDYKLKMRKR